MAPQTLRGIDRAQYGLPVCMVTPTGTRQTHTAVARGTLWTLRARQPPALLCMEACGGAPAWARGFGARGPAGRFWAPPYVTPVRRGQNNDPHEALALPEAGPRPTLPTGPMKTIEQQARQARPRGRARLVQHRTAGVKQVRGLLLEYGSVLPPGRARLRQRLPRVCEEAAQGCSGLRRDLLQSPQRALRALDTRRTAVTGQRARLRHAREAWQRLRAMEGRGGGPSVRQPAGRRWGMGILFRRAGRGRPGAGGSHATRAAAGRRVWGGSRKGGTPRSDGS